ncbi:arsenate reductase/protein-tyrosine-phosphatase family protein [Paraburkholderia aspalathi]|jgi:protein-tyrosine phosphatase|uniref:arsenate reductase/protein-tyrosine-phosphatase family protein n=1 Tax=Paraburkholderia aspalathi TaxID=1324617 RepID=UPI0038BBA929
MLETILIVCEANMCRSPMAEMILANRLPDKTIMSAGLCARPGRPADRATAQLMLERGYDLSAHLTTLLTLTHAKAAHLILTMTLDQRSRIECAYPFTRGKVYRLGEHDDFDITDPYLHPRAAYEESFAQIEVGIDNWIPGIRKCG